MAEGEMVRKPARAQRRDLVALLRATGNECNDEGDRFSALLCRRLWEKAAAGNMEAAKLLLAYLVGRPVQRVQTDLQLRRGPSFTADEAAQAAAELGMLQLPLLPVEGVTPDGEPA